MAICALKTLKRKRDEYDELINQMQHQAYLDMVNAEREVGIDILEFEFKSQGLSVIELSLFKKLKMSIPF